LKFKGTHFRYKIIKQFTETKVKISLGSVGDTSYTHSFYTIALLVYVSICSNIVTFSMLCTTCAVGRTIQ